MKTTSPSAALGMGTDSSKFFDAVKRFLNNFLPEQKGASEATIKSYKKTLNQYIYYLKTEHNIPIQEVSFKHFNKDYIEMFLLYGKESRGWGVSTRNQKLSSLRSFLKFSGSHDICNMSTYMESTNIPLKKNRDPHTIDIFSREQIITLFHQPATSKKTEHRNLVIMILLYDTGCRIDEVLNLKLSDLYLQTKTPYVLVKGKGSKYRQIPLMDRTVEQLNAYIKKFHSNSSSDDPFFYTHHSGEKTVMVPNTVQKFMDRYCVSAKAEDPDFPDHIYPHMFRHTRATDLYEGGMDITLVSEWLGHASVNTTREFYVNISMERKKAQLEKVTIQEEEEYKSEYDFNDEDLIKQLYGLA